MSLQGPFGILGKYFVEIRESVVLPVMQWKSCVTRWAEVRIPWLVGYIRLRDLRYLVALTVS